MAADQIIAKITPGKITAYNVTYRCDRCWRSVPNDSPACPECKGPRTAMLELIMTPDGATLKE